jgi:HEAT repeat protein
VRRLVAPLALLLGLLPSVFGAAPWSRADGPDPLVPLLAAYEGLAGRRDDQAYAAQTVIVERMADLATADARAALKKLLETHGPSDRRTAVILLSGLVRRGGPVDLDAAVTWVERRRDAHLLGQLSRVASAAQEPATRTHLYDEALPRAVPAVKAQLARAVGALGEAAGVGPLLALLSEPHVVVKVEALGALGLLGDGRALPALVAALKEEDWRLREAGARALGMLGATAALSEIVQRLADPVPLVVESAATALSLLGAAPAVDPLIERLAATEQSDLRVADTLARALERLTGKALGTDASAWRAWWAVRRDKPFVKEAEPPGGGTVPTLRYHGFPVRSSKVVFVLDISRSMGWNGRLETAQKELTEVLEHLPRTTRFNLIVFSDRAWPWEGSLVPASLANVRRAAAYVGRQRPISGTAAYEALEAAFADQDVDTIFFLSDGHPSGGTVVDPELILADVAEWNRFRRVRIHAVALLAGEPPAAFAGTEDADRATSFMRRLAAENSGDFKIVRQ